MMVAGFAPIHATASGFSKDEVAFLMVAMQLGTILFQLPFGWISDRTDRRFVLIAAALVVMVAGIAASQTQGAAFLVIMLIFMAWGGATESIYSISNAHANDRAGKGDLVALSSTMLFAWSVSGFIFPAIATALTTHFGTQAFMYVAVVIAALFCLFVAWRIRQAPAAAEQGSFAPMTAQVPVPAELAFSQDSEER
jgi:MFS family permease